MNFHNFEEEVKNTVDRAIKEMSATKILNDIKKTWYNMEFEWDIHPQRNVKLLKVSEQLIETLDDNQMQLQNISTSKYIEFILPKIIKWQEILTNIDSLITLWFEVQRKWMYLESIFIGSSDIRAQLPDDSKNFEEIDIEFTELLLKTVNESMKMINIIKDLNEINTKLQNILKRLIICEKALNNYLETKRLTFPRFYFISSADLLDILSNGNNPKLVDRHLIKLFDSILRFEYKEIKTKAIVESILGDGNQSDDILIAEEMKKCLLLDENNENGNAFTSSTSVDTTDISNKQNVMEAIGMHSKENDEYVEFITPFQCSGRVELWLNKAINVMRTTLKHLFKTALWEIQKDSNLQYIDRSAAKTEHLVSYTNINKNRTQIKSRGKWIFDWPAQTALCCSQICWTSDVNRAFALLEEGYETAMKDFHKEQISQLNALINLLLGELSPGDRQKIMTICTIDVHCRDVVLKIIQTKVENSMAFQWQSQLRHRWDTNINDCYANICDAEFLYAYEYLGNTTRLVITPLTDRCYITLTQSLHLVMGGAPAGPAGTGKTETTKDLGRALGVMVYVFNCSEQMDYKSCGNIYKGLAQTGAWGCFDEFNRISVEVLSVIAVQVKTIQDAIKSLKTKFLFMGEEISLVSSVGIFITMNPGYAGRTELPENLKTLFRPCAMIVPDFALICEIMLVAEGFQNARLLARKFITLYTLCKELLSKQDHYDWGLRAIKSVLVVAGALKRGDPNRPEDQVLMRALRDFNIPKIVTEDISIFVGLVGDLFPALDVPRKRLLDFERTIRKAVSEIKLQPEENFILKIVQLQELLSVRHSVFIVGNAGTGKTRIWQSLLATFKYQKKKPHYSVLNPKALSNDELFGVVNATTREWKDGLFSSIIRDQANIQDDNPKWIILDGDIDPMWIESLNTLMDDNKVLTLASNERIALKKDMRLLFEVGHLKSATPATVSRAGILYINPQDLGWFPYVSSWVETRENIIERGILTTLFEKYFPNLIKKIDYFKKITPISDISMIQLTCFLLEYMLDGHNIKPEFLEKNLEIIFVFVTIWGFGSSLSDQDHLIDWRREFHKWWIMEYKDIKFPNDGTIFDFYLDQECYKFKLWENLIQKFELDPELPLQNVLVPTIETCRLTYFVKKLLKKHHPVMLVGGSGCGKYSIYREIFNSYDGRIDIRTANFNYYTNSDIFQKILDYPLEKKSGRFYAPTGNKRLIYYISDLNMPEVDSYGTVQSHTVIRQFMDYHQWYDRNKLTLKEIRNCQFAVSMNPTAGSFTIDPRLQRHFCIFTVNSPNEETLIHIFSTILEQHLENFQNSFTKEIKSINHVLCSVGVALHRRIESAFLPTAVKFHYIFNLRDMSNIFQGLMNSNGLTCQKPMDLIRFYVHEAFRVYHDKLADHHDIKAFRSICRDIFKKDIEDFDEDYVFNEPLIYCNFAQSLLDQKYMPIKNWNTLYELLIDAQNSYNEIVGYMNLVMFEDAMLHVCRINRILENPRSNALLIGVGGSGKQTLARLASYISSLNVFQIQIKRGYTILDMKNELANLYTKVGLKNVASVFLISDAQIPDESILMLVNDMLASGEIPELFTDDQFETIINGIRNEVKQNGTLDTKDNCWKFFIEKVRRLLKTVLCFSPVGTTLRVRVRKFPAIISRTSIDWFHEWPKTALESVSKKFLSEIDVLPGEVVDQIGCFMAYVHGTVNQISKIYFQNEKRFNYTTPKTFLEYISLYIKLLKNKSDEFTKKITRLETGMSKLAECAIQVEMLKKQLAIQEIELNAKNDAADNLIVIVGAENEKVKKEKFAAYEEEQRVRIIEEDVCIKTQLCEEDLRRAEPALVAAHEALDTLNKNNLTELKSFGSPPKAVVNVCAAVMVLFALNGRIPKDRSWKAAKLMMVKVDQFLNDLVNYDKDNIHPNVIEALQDYLKDPEFNPDKIVQKSVAAAGLCAWVINLHRYHEIFQIVGPKQKALEDSQEELQEARERLSYLKEKICNLEKKLSQIQSEFSSALEEKQRCQLEADKTAFTIDLAHRLVNGLSNENIRWKESVLSLRNKIVTLPGDILLISSFLSYVGCFTRRYRQELQEKLWIPTFKKIEPIIPHTEGVDPLTLIADDAQIALWNNEGLPMDRMSTENATILTNSTRWPLMIDPQLQGLKWIKNRLGDNLIIIRLSQKGYLDIIEKAMSTGKTVLIEQISESLDAVLEPLLSRSLIKKGRFIRIGDKEMDYNPEFRLILHTKIPNPHYKPEMQAQTTLINFTVTPDGLEEQLLAEVVKIERPDLENMKTEVTIQQNKFKISLKELEDELLVRLATAGENVLEDAALVLNLEATKKTVCDIEIKVEESKITTLKIDETRDIYRYAAKRAAILYFVLNDLHKINPIYKFSLKAFMIVFKRAISMAEINENLNKRVESLVNSITYQTHLYTSRGLFERDKLILTSHMVLRIMINSKKINKDEMDFLLRYPHDPNNLSPYEFISKESWGGIRYLALIENFYGLDKDIENYTNRWKKFIISEMPEREIFPGEWKLRTPLQKLCIIRAVRPDRMIYAMRLFIEQTMGKCYTEEKVIPFNEIFKEITSSVPVFFILSPGIDPIRDVEILGKQLGYTIDNGKLHNISLGQGQEYVAEKSIETSIKYGHWVILQNVHLVAKWLPRLEKLIERTTSAATSTSNKILSTYTKLKQNTTNSITIPQNSTIETENQLKYNNHYCHPEFRLYISAEPAPDPECHVIPQGILECSMKIVNEPPTGMAANLHKAWNNFSQETLETCTQEVEFKSILFTLCYFHSVLIERRKFGAQGWNKNYPFNIGDLTISANVLYNYLEGSNRTPWEDLRYLFGEIMYGGHITDDWDRRLCRTYLDVLMIQDLIDGDFELCPGFLAPPNLDFDGYHNFIDDNLPDESPILYGLHQNAEIGFLTSTSENLLKIIFELQPRESELCSDVCTSREEIVKIMIDDILDKLQDEFKIIELIGRIDKKTPFVVVALQECERMNILIREIKRSLRELMLGLKGELTITSEMESLDNAIFYDYIPETWSKLAYPSLLRLQPWLSDLYWRIKDLSSWVIDFTLPSTVWLGGLFNPQSFLTAIMQESARKNDLPLDKMCLCCEVTKKEKDGISSSPKEGAFIHGLFIEGASWDCNANSIVELRPKELYSLMPVMYIKSIIQEKQDIYKMYECPLYRTRGRGPTYIWTFNLRTKEHPSKWILGGVALLLQT
ncbi:dynein beta chain, ciliary isoform X2 [Condylostylus longicornis]|uniref:dynein beta chain, ciliary isoform X2 n=1 Tax=Condylostylus longicornis TaxID=2530218 RepID=UPI00244DCAB8|nr:dynein beta chain, ciliary isoform X2 [Condylostylus longicornis]